MKEHPILFSGPMVRAMLAGTKTQTRRIVTAAPGKQSEWLTPEALVSVRRFAPSIDGRWTIAVGEPSRIVHCGVEMDGGHIGSIRCPYGAAGDRLWVRETWAGDDCCGFVYRADHPGADLARGDLDDGEQTIRQWRPSIFMPRALSRITLEIVSVRAERLHDITDDDIRAEGVTVEMVAEMHGTTPERIAHPRLRNAWGLGWNKINGKRASWASNPWVWRIEFRRLP